MRALWHSIAWTLRRRRVGLISLLFGIVVFESLQPIAIDSFGNLDRLQPLLKLVPPSFWALMNVTPDFLENAGLAGYLSLGFTHPTYLFLCAAAVVWFGSNVLAGEMERGSIQFALARPVSRPLLFISRLIAMLVVTTLVACAGPIGMAAGMIVSRPEGIFAFEHLFTVGLAAWLLFWSIAGTTLLWSAVSSTMSRAVGIGVGVLIVSYVIDYFAALWSFLRPIAPLSVFHYYDPSSALAKGALAWTSVVVLALVGIAGALAGYFSFVRRDLPV